MKKTIILLLFLSMIVFKFMGLHGVAGLLILPLGLVIGGLILFTMWKIVKYFFLGGIVICSIGILILSVGMLLTLM